MRNILNLEKQYNPSGTKNVKKLIDMSKWFVNYNCYEENLKVLQEDRRECRNS